MIPLWLALPALLGFVLVGAAIERAGGVDPRLDATALAWTMRGVLGMAAYVAFVVHPLAAIVFVVGLALHRRRLYPASPPGTPSTGLTSTGLTSTRSTSPVAMKPVYLAALGVLVAIVAARPAVPLVWDEHVWLSKARVACEGPWVLAARALDPEGGLVPAGYAIGTPALQAALAAFLPDLSALTGGAAGLVLVAVATFVVVFAGARDVFRPAVVLGILGAPLAWVHLRTGLLDLPLGLLCAAFALSLVAAARGQAQYALLAPALAALMAGLKDEGALYVCTLSLAMALASSDARAVRPHAAASVVAALLVAGTWRVELAVAGIGVEHHAIVGFALDAVPALATELGRALSDVGSVGAALPVALAAVVASLFGRGPSLARGLALGWVLSLSGLLLGLVLGPPAAREFALGGTVFARALMQLLPLAALALGAAIHERDGRIASTISPPSTSPPSTSPPSTSPPSTSPPATSPSSTETTSADAEEPASTISSAPRGLTAPASMPNLPPLREPSPHRTPSRRDP